MFCQSGFIYNFLQEKSLHFADSFALSIFVPSHDTFGDVFSSLDPNAVRKVIDVWLVNMKEEIQRLREHETTKHVIAFDGKTICRSGNEKHKAHHIVTAYCSDLQLVLGQECTEEKSNEITVIPKLLEMLKLKGCTVTIDATGTQKDIAEKIREKGAEYILCLKGNQPDILEFAQQHVNGELADISCDEVKKAGRYAITLEKGHGGIEKKEWFLFPGMDWYDRAAQWKDAAGVAVIQSTRTMPDGSFSAENRYYIYSRSSLSAEDFMAMQRSHWGSKTACIGPWM